LEIDLKNCSLDLKTKTTGFITESLICQLILKKFVFKNKDSKRVGFGEHVKDIL